MRSAAINRFTRIKLSPNEMEDIFIPETRKVCQTCHKVRIKKKIEMRSFSPRHRRIICDCYNNNNNRHN